MEPKVEDLENEVIAVEESHTKLEYERLKIMRKKYYDIKIKREHAIKKIKNDLNQNDDEFDDLQSVMENIDNK